MNLVERLRSYLPLGDGSYWSPSSKAYAEAADRIEALELEKAELVEALEKQQLETECECKNCMYAREALAKVRTK